METRLDKIDALCDQALSCDATYVDWDWSENTAAICRLLNEAAAESEVAHSQALAVALNWGRFDVLGQDVPSKVAVIKVVEAIDDTPIPAQEPLPVPAAYADGHKHGYGCDGNCDEPF